LEVLTVTMNPALDREIFLDGFEINKLHRIFDPSKMDMTPGGKGINVSMALANFGVKNVAMGVLAGYMGRVIEEELRKYSELITTNFVHTNGESRENITIMDEVNQTITEINAPGPTLDEETIEQFFQRYEMTLSRVSHVVISGTVPPGVPMDFYKTLSNVASKKGKIVLMEARGQLLTNAILSEGCPKIVKPDLRADRKCLGIELKNIDDYVKVSKIILERGADLVVLSYEIIKNVVATREGIWLLDTSQQVDISHVLGTGDTYVAGILYYLLRRDKDLFEASKFGYIAAVAKLRYSKKIFPSIKEIEIIRDNIKVERIV